MNKVTLSGVLGFSVLVLVGWMLWYFFLTIQDADANVKAGIVGALGILLAAIVTNFFTRRREINARHFFGKASGIRKDHRHHL